MGKPLLQWLKKEPELNRLIESLALADRRHFAVLVCKQPRQAQLTLSIIRSEVAKRSGKPVNIIRRTPNYQGDDTSFSNLVESVLRPLMDWADDRSFDGKWVFVIDASEGEGSLSEPLLPFFRRMNEVRNALLEQLPGPLLLILPKNLQAEFAHQAPDFWSVCSAFAQVHGLPEDLEEFRGGRRSKALQPFKYRRKTQMQDILDSRQDLNPKNFEIEREKALDLRRRGDVFRRRGSWEHAKTRYEKAIARFEAILKIYPGDRPLRLDLSETLIRLAKVEKARGAQSVAQQLQKKAQSLLEDLEAS